jgi:protein-S-isoprenylcysteine O-methyltransferase Ste14
MGDFFSILTLAASLTGAIAIAAPMFLAIRNSSRGEGRRQGGGAAFRKRPFIILSSVCLLGVGILLWIPIPAPSYFPSPSFSILLGSLLYFPGLGLYLWGLKALGSHFGVSTVLGAGLYPHHAIIQNGPFGLLRHPMYLGVLLAGWGAFLIFRTIAMAVFAPLTFVAVFRAKQEEKLMAKEFREEWEEYTRRVPKWVPRIHRPQR